MWANVGVREAEPLWVRRKMAIFGVAWDDAGKVACIASVKIYEGRYSTWRDQARKRVAEVELALKLSKCGITQL
jgi:hypothetical protein